MTTNAAMPAGAVFTAEMTGNAVKNNVNNADSGGGFMGELSEKLAKGRPDTEAVQSEVPGTATGDMQSTADVSGTEQLRRELDDELVKNAAAFVSKEMAASVSYAPEINELTKGNAAVDDFIGSEIEKVASTDIRQLIAAHSENGMIPESVIRFLDLHSEEFMKLLQNARPDLLDAVPEIISLDPLVQPEQPTEAETDEMPAMAVVPERTDTAVIPEQANTEVAPEQSEIPDEKADDTAKSDVSTQYAQAMQSVQTVRPETAPTDTVRPAATVSAQAASEAQPAAADNAQAAQVMQSQVSLSETVEADTDKTASTDFAAQLSEAAVQTDAVSTAPKTDNGVSVSGSSDSDGSDSEGSDSEGKSLAASDDMGFEVIESRTAPESRSAGDTDTESSDESGNMPMFAKHEAAVERTQDRSGEMSELSTDSKDKAKPDTDSKVDVSKTAQGGIAQQMTTVTQSEKAAPEQGTRPVYPRMTADEVYSAITENAKTETGRQDFTFRLNPESLGRITVKLVNEGGKLSVEIITETKAARDLFRSGEDRLAQTLRQNDIEIDSYRVEQSDSELFSESFEGSSKNPYKQRDAENTQGDGSDGEAFEGIIGEMLKMDQS